MDTELLNSTDSLCPQRHVRASPCSSTEQPPPQRTRPGQSGSYAPSLTVTSSVMTWHSSDLTLTPGTVPVTPPASAVTM